jgi:L-ribulose-5-phosphate 3-epimerase
MPPHDAAFAVNTYAYCMSHGAQGCLGHLAQQGYTDFELVLFPGHLWPAELDSGARRRLREHTESKALRLITLNMLNIDINVAAASREMRDYSLAMLCDSVVLAGELGVPGVIVGPGKPNPLFPLPRARMMEYFYAALDRLVPLAAQCGTAIWIENLPIAFLPDADGLMSALDRYGNASVGIVYDVANAVFHREDPVSGLRRVRERLRLVHLSDTGHELYRHDPVGRGVVPFAALPPVLDEIGYTERPMLEIITATPDRDIRASAEKLLAMGWRGKDMQ